jgi:hypothetical protein
MKPAIRAIELWTHAVTPAEADVRLRVEIENWPETTEVLGRVVGPRCRYATTVEVAYPWRPLPDEEGSVRLFRAIVPEPSLWEPECPFVYHGIVELRQAGQPIERRTLPLGLRSLGRQGGTVWVNGRPFVFRATEGVPGSEADALRMRSVGTNVFVADIHEGETRPWDLADEVGTWVLGRITSDEERTVRWAVDHLGPRPSHLAWVVDDGFLERPETWRTTVGLLQPAPPRKPSWLALAVSRPLENTPPEEVSLLVCDASQLPSLERISLPKVVF